MFLVTATKPASSDAARAETTSRDFLDREQANACAETYLRDGLTNVQVWNLLATPRLRQIVDWSDREGE